MISLRNIEKAYQHGVGKTYVLRRVNLDVTPGDFLSVMGPSGAGKSTLLHILGMHDSAWTGEYHFLENPVHEIRPKDRAKLHKQYIRVRLPELSPAGQPDGLREPRDPAFLS